MNCKHGNKLEGPFKVLSLEEVKKLFPGEKIYIKARCGCFLKVRVNGMPVLWKRSPERVKVPYKYGLYEHGHITESCEVRVPVPKVEKKEKTFRFVFFDGQSDVLTDVIEFVPKYRKDSSISEPTQRIIKEAFEHLAKGNRVDLVRYEP